MDHLNAEMKYSTVLYTVLHSPPPTSNVGQEIDMLKVYFLNLQTTWLVFNFWRMVYKKCFIGTKKDKIMK